MLIISIAEWIEAMEVNKTGIQDVEESLANYVEGDSNNIIII